MEPLTSEGLERRILSAVSQINEDAAKGLSRDTPWKEAGIGSLDLAEIAFLIEDEFKIVIDFSAAAVESEMKTVGDLISVVERLIAEQGASSASARG